MVRSTIVEVARSLGVAPSTVSRAFNEPHRLRHETVARIKAAADAMGYVPNRHAQALSTGRSSMIGLIVPDLCNPFFPPMVRAAQREAELSGLTVVVAETNSDPDHERRQVDTLLPECDGLVVASSRRPHHELRELAATARVVLVNADVDGLARVLISSRAALAEAIRELVARGDRTLCYVGGPAKSWSEQERRSTVAALAAELGLDVTYLRAELGTYADAAALMPEVLASGATAVIAFDDILAHAVVNGLAEAGRSIPRDVRVLGCDDALPIETRPQLSTIELLTGQAGEAAVRILATTQGRPRESRTELAGVLRRRGTT